MKRRWWKQSTTLLVIREAEQAVRQVSIPKLLIVSVPVAAIMSISGLILDLQWKSSQHIQELEEQISSQAMVLDVTVKDKEQAIRKLQEEVVRLSTEAKEVKQRVQKISHWEQQLEQFVEGNLKSRKKEKPVTASMPSASTSIATSTKQLGGELHALTDTELYELAQQSQFDLQEVQKLITSMEESIPAVIQQAKQKQTQIQGTPSLWPTKSQLLTSGFGYRQDPITGQAAFHAGIDIAGNVGDSIYAAADGRVVTSEFNHARGNYIIISHVNGLETWYMHLSALHVSPGDSVSKGDKIGELGSTGRSTGPHLHFQVMQRGEATNPLPYVETTHVSPNSSKKRDKI